MITAATCLAMAVYYEARGENLDGMTHVAQVIVNRKNHSDFPDTICGVVKEDRGSKSYDCQFSFYCDGKAENPRDLVAWSTAKDVAYGSQWRLHQSWGHIFPCSKRQTILGQHF